MSLIEPLFGHYEIVGDPADADCIMGHSFGTDTSPQGVNRQLAEVMNHYAEGRPLVADRNIVRADPRGEGAYAHIIDGQITKMDGQSGTGKALENAKAYMSEHNLARPLMIAQRYHIDRVVRQAAKLGMASIVPVELPDQFDKSSTQIWTTRRSLFILANMLAYAKLRYDGDI